MKKKYPLIFITVILMVVSLVSPVLARADEKGTLPGSDIKYTITYSEDVVKLIISGSGEIPSVVAEKEEVQLYFDDYAREKVTQIEIGKGITVVGDYAFAAFVNVNKLTLPSTLKTIGHQSFMGLLKMKSVNIPKNVEYIDAYAFYRCDVLSKFTVTSGNTTFSAKEGALVKDGGKTLALVPPAKSGKYDVPSGIKKISVFAFSLTSGITDINIPASVTEIEMSDEYGNYIFYNLKKLYSINVDSDNEAFSSLEGVLYNDIEKAIFCWPRDRSGSGHIKEGTKIIKSFAFYGVRAIYDLTLPESTEEIHSYAFYNTTTITWDGLVIPKNVNKIEFFAFENSHMVRFTVDEENEYYASIDETLLTKDKTVLLRTNHKGTIPEGVRIIAPDAMSGWDAAYNTRHIIPEGVEIIGEGAYYNVDEIVSITFPKSLKYIGDGAFYGLDRLSDLTFYENVEYIGASAFQSSKNLKKIVFYGDAPVIEGADTENYTFGNKEEVRIFYDENKSGWTSPEWNGYKSFPLVLTEKLTDTISIEYDLHNGIIKYTGTGSIPSCDRYGDEKPWQVYLNLFDFEKLIIGEGITDIGAEAFENLVINDVSLPSTLESIGVGAFSYCTLKTINIPDKITEIEDYVFKECEYLQEYPLTENIVKIGKYALSGICDHTSPVLTIPASVKELGSNAFTSSYVSDIVFEGVVEVIADHAFFNMVFSEPYDLVIPEGVTYIGKSAFSNIWNLKSVVVPGSCKVIGEGAFASNRSLENITLSYGVEEIGRHAFDNELEKIIIPSSVRVVEKAAIAGYYVRTTFYFNGDAPEIAESIPDLYREDVTVYYVEGRAGWTSPQWNGFKTATWEGTEPVDATVVTAMIGNIGEITFENHKNVQSIRNRYESLSDEEKTKVTNLDVLIAAEKAVQDVVNAAAAKVIALISQIGDNVLAEKHKIEEALKQYEELGEYKYLVTNYDILKSKYDELMSYNTGDVNGDGKINALDATQILRYANNKTSALDSLVDAEAVVKADVNKDGKINALDATQILRYANNKPSAVVGIK